MEVECFKSGWMRDNYIDGRGKFIGSESCDLCRAPVYGIVRERARLACCMKCPTAERFMKTISFLHGEVLERSW